MNLFSLPCPISFNCGHKVANEPCLMPAFDASVQIFDERDLSSSALLRFRPNALFFFVLASPALPL